MSIEPMNQDELKALQERRDQRWGWWDLSAEEVARAYAAGWRLFDRAYLRGANLRGANLGGAYLEGANLRDANLEGANLRDAYLEGAYLEGANLIHVPGVYSVFSPNLSSRGAALQGGLVIEGGAIQLRFWAGCKECVTAEQLRGYVRETHGAGESANLHAKHYEVAIACMETAFALDDAADTWSYLMTWDADHVEAAAMPQFVARGWN